MATMQTNEEQVQGPGTPPTTTWRAAFREQMTEKTMERALAAVEALLEGPDGWLCSTSAADLVHDALVATGRGEVTWAPERVPLWVHLRDRARSTMRRERGRALREVPLVLSEDDPQGAAIERDHLWTLPDLPAAIDLRREIEAEEARLWRVAARDQGVLAVMNARACGYYDNVAIARVSGLSLAAVVAARRRLGRLVRKSRRVVAELAS